MIAATKIKQYCATENSPKIQILHNNNLCHLKKDDYSLNLRIYKIFMTKKVPN